MPSPRRTIDVLLSSALLVLLSPALVCVSALILFFTGSPILFRQTRIGLHEKPFTLFKFRTMREPSASEERFLTDGDRVTHLGRILRATSLDELPQLINIFLGEMTFIGPRPLLPEYLPLYSDEERRRHHVRPGVTGLAQVSGRQRLTFKERFRLDVRYVDEQSLRLDIRILVETLRAALSNGAENTGLGFDDIDDFGAREAALRIEPHDRAPDESDEHGRHSG